MATGGDATGGTGNEGGAPDIAGDPGTKVMHRLNDAEYNNTVQDLLQTALAPASGWLGGEAHGFDNIAEVLSIDDPQYEKYFNAASQLADDVFGNPALAAQIVTCPTTDDPTCVQSIVQGFGAKAWRRPLTPDEVTTFTTVYTTARGLGEDHAGSVKQVVRAMLSSAEFLYRIEFDPDPTSLVPHLLDPYEMASRLAYFQWSSMPDDALFQAAADGSLSTPDGVAAQLDRMLQDPKSDRFVRNFSGQWLGVRNVASHAVDASVFPDWTPQLGLEMSEEAYGYFSSFVHTERPYSEFLTADLTISDPTLAQFYGDSPAGARVGFLGLGAFLSISSYPNRTAPTLRARWILDNLVCEPPAPPPAGLVIPKLDDEVTAGGQDPSQVNIRERLQQHRTDPVCNTCHGKLDPFGLALENFDAIGRFRTQYANGDAIDASGQMPDGTTFNGLSGMAQTVTAKDDFNKCVTEKLFIYGLGRGDTDADKVYLDDIRQKWLASGQPSLHSLIKQIVLADTFRFRHAGI